MKYKILLVFTFFVISFISCKKRTFFPVEKDGMVIWTFSPLLDGCGYFIKIDSDYYKPIDDLAPEFEQDGLLVSVKFKLKGEKEVCAFGSKTTTMKVIEINKN